MNNEKIIGLRGHPSHNYYPERMVIIVWFKDIILFYKVAYINIRVLRVVLFRAVAAGPADPALARPIFSL